jgi:hypothetical protein
MRRHRRQRPTIVGKSIETFNNSMIFPPGPFNVAPRICALLILLLSPPALLSQEHYCGMQATEGASTTFGKAMNPHGGAYLPTKGTVRGLVVFAQTLNDTQQSEAWPLGQLPVWAHEYTDRLQRYFSDMSFGELDLRLDVHPQCMVTKYKEADYVEWMRRYGDAVKDFIDTLDAQIDFGQYDLWTSMSNAYRIKPGPDGQVDLMILIFRRITNSYFMPFAGVSDLGFSGYKFVDGSTERFFYGGSGAFNDASASGVSMCRLPGHGVLIDAEYTFNVTVHELGHKFFGDSHPAELFGGLGIMANSGNGYAMNSFERQLAGYISFRELNPHRDTIVTLRDYVTTGDAVLLPVPEGMRSYYSFEFRGKHSHWDSAPIPGLYAFRVYDSPNYSSKLIQVASAEGRFDWAVDSTSNTIYQLRPNALGGYTRFQRIPIGGKTYWAEGSWGDARSAYTLSRPELAIHKNPTPDFLLGSDTVRTGLRIRLLALDDSSATLSISYQQPAILDAVIVPDATIAFGTPYPQPAETGGAISIPVRSDRIGSARAEVFDMLGRRVAAYTDLPFMEHDELHLPLRNIPAGAHTVLIHAGGTVHRLRISVISR